MKCNTISHRWDRDVIDAGIYIHVLIWYIYTRTKGRTKHTASSRWLWHLTSHTYNTHTHTYNVKYRHHFELHHMDYTRWTIDQWWPPRWWSSCTERERACVLGRMARVVFQEIGGGACVFGGKACAAFQDKEGGVVGWRLLAKQEKRKAHTFPYEHSSLNIDIIVHGPHNPIATSPIHHTSYIIHHTSYVIHRASYIIHHTSCIIHHTSYIIYHTSCIIHHTSYVIHHASYI